MRGLPPMSRAVGVINVLARNNLSLFRVLKFLKQFS